jgi:hypothetical protein
MAADQGFVYFAVTRFDLADRTLAFFEGVFLFVDYLFDTWPLRKVYADSLEFNFDQFAGGTATFFEVEGRLKDHVYLKGRYWDQIILAVWRERWKAERARYLKLLRIDEADPHGSS